MRCLISVIKKLNSESKDNRVFLQVSTQVALNRIIDKKTIGGKQIYHTQGDANLTRDEGYRLYDDIVGQVKLRIPYIGYFTLWINGLIGGNE